MADTRVWVRGVPGRLTRIERGQAYLSVTDWARVPLTRRIQKKADRGSLELSFSDPAAAKKPKPAPVVEPSTKEAE